MTVIADKQQNPQPHKFKFNSSGCCTNPIQEILYNKGNEYVHIVLAEKNGNWYFGYSYTYGPYRGGGGCSACTGKVRQSYPDEMKCRFAAITTVLDSLKKSNNEVLSPVIERLEGELLGKQLNLF